jgi:hypothetical protein
MLYYCAGNYLLFFNYKIEYGYNFILSEHKIRN